jgi:anti-anti-sigma regulatory factor
LRRGRGASGYLQTARQLPDLQATTFCDTAGVQEMLLAQKAAVAEGIDLRVVVPARLMLQFTRTGIDQVLAVYPSVNAALAAAGSPAGG